MSSSPDQQAQLSRSVSAGVADMESRRQLLRPMSSEGAGKQRAQLKNPMLEHKDAYVVNMWKYYNHRYLANQTSGKLQDLLWYSAFVCVLIYGVTLLPPPAVMLRHQEAVSDLLLGEEFPAETTHIFKSFYDVMTAQEMWEWATGPLADALLVEGAADGNMAALLGTNWLLGPVRIRQERSSRESESMCRGKLADAFGNRTAEKLVRRGVDCTQNWAQDSAAELEAPLPRGAQFLELAKPLGSLNGASFIDAFPDWYSTHALANRSETAGAVCCAKLGCFRSELEQDDAILRTQDEGIRGVEAACSVNLTSHMLMPNPLESYRSDIKADPTESTSLWAQNTNFGTGGFHIDLSGDSSTFRQQLLALQELGFTDQDTRTVTFQLTILNANTFSRTTSEYEHEGFPQDELEHDPIVLVCVDINFVFAPSGHVQSYDRITSMQLRPLPLISNDETQQYQRAKFMNVVKILVFNLVPIVMLLKEVKVLAKVGVAKWIRSGWSWFEIIFFASVMAFTRAFLRYNDEERVFLAHYNPDRYNVKEDEFLARYGTSSDELADFGALFNDSMPLRKAYRNIAKHLAHFCLIAAFKLFKYVKIFRSTTLLWDTLRYAGSQLMAYSAVMLWVIIAFSLCAVLLWGSYSSHFHNIPAAFFQLLRLAAGESTLEYDELKRAHAHWTPLLFFFFIVFVAILGMNLMVAIITDFYEEARDRRMEDDEFSQWAQDEFCGTGDHEDFYRGKGLWNCPATPTDAGTSGEAYQALCGRWTVKPVPDGGGPRRWDPDKKEVKPAGNTHSYPFILRRSTKVQLRYDVQAHESDASLFANTDDAAASIFSSAKPSALLGASTSRPDEHTGGNTTTATDVRSKSKARASVMTALATLNPTRADLQQDVHEASHHQLSGKSALFAEKPLLPQHIRDQAEPADDRLDLWMAASTLTQYKGIRFLEELQQGDIISLSTPAEGGHVGHIELRFVEFRASRRATRQDKLAISREIHAAREKYYDARERYLMYDEAKDEAKKEQIKRQVEDTEANLQVLHQQRGQLEGVERSMIFEVAGADAWQKFRPIQANERRLGERLKDACVREHFPDFPHGHEELERWLHHPTEQNSLKLEAWLRCPEKHTITKQTVVKVVADIVLSSLLSPDEMSRDKLEANIADQIIKELADEEQNVNTLGYANEEHRTEAAAPEGCCSSSLSGAKLQHAKATGSDHANVMTKLHTATGGEGVKLGMLVPDYDDAHPTVSSATNRLMKAALRAGKDAELATWVHTPLLDINETAQFEMHIPTSVRLAIVRRSISKAWSQAWSAVWKNPVKNCQAMCSWLMSWFPLHTVSNYLFFHASVEQDIEDFLDAKCEWCYRSMPRGSHDRICAKREQMLEYMTAENSVSLQDFSYQLAHFVFKVKPRSLAARFRIWMHNRLKDTVLKHCFSGLRLPLRTQYTHVEQEIAMQYLLRHYHDFIDRRRGSIPMRGDAYCSGGVLLDHVTRMALQVTEEDHAATLKHLEATRQELEETKQEVAELKAQLAGATPANSVPRDGEAIAEAVKEKNVAGLLRELSSLAEGIPGHPNEPEPEPQ